MFHEDRTPKFSWDQPVSEHPDWPLQSGISVALGLGILALTRFWRHGAGMMPRVLSSLGAMLAGTALVLHVQHGWLAARNDWEWLLECGIGLLALASAVLLIGAALAGRLRDCGGSLLEAVAWLRRPLALPGIRQSIALLRLAALIGAATVSLGLCFDSRYRDFPIEAYLVPALFFLVVDLARRGIVGPQADRREEAALGLLLAGMAVFVFINETPLNLEADLWCALTVLLALPGIGAWRGLYVQRRMMRRSAANRPTAASPAL
jgi:glucan 1,3-beta-glucosidase